MMTDSPPGGNYTSFELWPMFLTLSTPGFVKNIIYPLRYSFVVGIGTELMSNFILFKQSRRDAGGGKVHGNYFPNKTFLCLSSTDDARYFFLY